MRKLTDIHEGGSDLETCSVIPMTMRTFMDSIQWTHIAHLTLTTGRRFKMNVAFTDYNNMIIM